MPRGLSIPVMSSHGVIPKLPGETLRDYVLAELDRALAQLSSTGSHLHAGVHQGRKSMRRTRATLKLCAASLGRGAEWIDHGLQQANRSLSALRDAHALVQLLERLADKAHDEDTRRVLQRARRLAATRRAHAARDLASATAMADARAMLSTLRAATDSLSWHAITPDTLAAGLANSEARAGRAHAHVCRRGKDPDWHAWRRQLRRLSQQRRACAAAGFECELSTFDKSLAEQLGAMQDLSLLLDHCGRHSPFADDDRKALRDFATPALARQRKRVLSVTQGLVRHGTA